MGVLLGLICVAVAASAQLPTAAQAARGMVSAIQWGALVTTSTRNQSEGSQPGDAFGNPNSLADVAGVPLPFFKVSMARWMAKYLTYGVLSTISTRSYGTTVGAPFGNPYSFADVDGALYMYACDLDASMIDVFTGNGTAPPNPRATLALSQAAYPDKILSNCKIGGFLGDPENPLCARLVFSGAVSKVAFGSDEEANAKAALFARHPSFKQFPAGHSFYVTKLAIDGIWLIDIFGGAAVISPSDYFKG